MVAEEDHLRLEGKTEVDSEEGTIRDEFAVLCRDLYALYPLLIRYVDNNRYLTVNHAWFLAYPLTPSYRLNDRVSYSILRSTERSHLFLNKAYFYGKMLSTK